MQIPLRIFTDGILDQRWVANTRRHAIGEQITQDGRIAGVVKAQLEARGMDFISSIQPKPVIVATPLTFKVLDRVPVLPLFWVILAPP